MLAQLLPAALLLAAPAEDSDEVREVIVHTEADGMTASGTTIGRRELDVMPQKGAEDALRLVPGVYIVQHGSQGKGYQFYLRGFDAVHGADIETRLDDVPINEASNVHAHGYLDLAFIIPEVVERVDATKGSYRLEQGNFATAGSIRYRLGVPQRGTRTRYEFGSTNRHRLSLVHAPKRAHKETFLAIEALDDEGYGDRRHARRLSSIGQARVFSRGGTTVTTMGSVYGARFELPSVVRLDDVNRGERTLYQSYSDDQRGESGRAIASVRVRTDRGRVRSSSTAWVQARRLTLDENFTGDLLFEEHGDRHLQAHAALSPGVFSRVEVRAHPRLSIPLTATWQTDVIEQSTDQLRTDGTVWSTSRDLSIVQHTGGLSAGVRGYAGDWAQIEAGGRFDVFHATVDDAVQDQRFTGTAHALSPRGMARFTPGERWQLFAAYGRGVRSPEARAYTLPSTPPENEDLSRFAGGQARVTRSDAAEVGARVQPGLFDVGLTGFATWIARESVFDHVSGFNIERSGTRRLGLESDVAAHPTRWLDLGASVTYAHARFVESSAPIPGAPPLVLGANASAKHPTGVQAGVRWFFLGPRPLSYGATAGLATVLDLAVGYRYRWAQVDLAVDNVLGARWREGEYHFASHWDSQRARSQIPAVHAVAGNPFSARVAFTVHWNSI